LITSIITFDKAPFKSILFHGFILDAHGIKMSKSKGNIVMPKDMIEKYGRDVLRFYLLSSPPWNDFYFNIEDTKEVAKQFNILRNTFNFVDTYVDKLPRTKRLKTEDKWLLSRINTITESYMENFQNYNGHKAVQELMDFILNDLSRWYIKLVRHRVWPLYKGKDKDGAFYTLVIVTKHLAKLLAPICPFIAEDVYQNVLRKYRKGLKSIHMYDFPEVDKKKINKKLEKQMEIVKRISEVSNFARQQAHLKLRWPVKRLIILSKNNEIKRAARDLEDILKNMCNVKNVRTGIKKPKGKFVESKFEETTILLDLEEDDKILFERLYRELTRNIQSMRKKNGLVVEERIALSLKSDEKTEKKLNKFKKDLKQDVGAKKVQIGELKGKFSSELTFKDKKVEISFSKV
jgi:isoleucyl-tRNA synthetase